MTEDRLLRLERLAQAEDQKARERADFQNILSAVLEALPEPLLVCGETMEITLVNNQTELVFGYHRSEIIGQPIEMLLPERYRSKHIEHRTKYVTRPAVREMGSGLNIVGLRKTGQEIPMDVKLAPVVTISGIYTIAIVRPLGEPRQQAMIPSADRDDHDAR